MAKRLPSAPPVLSGYSYIRPVGTGGFADVFLFEQDMPRRSVAVKVLLQDAVDEEVLRMFNAEADVMAQLSAHPAILTIYQASISADGRPYLVMEYCPSSLTNRYRREEIPLAEVLNIGVKIGSALETVHRAGLLHRDIKPSNILLTSFGAPVLSDFGIASTRANDGSEVFAMSVPWSAPEVVEERISGSVPAEVWSLGATVYSLLAGRSPFERAGAGQNDREQLRSRIRHAQYTPTGRADVPAVLEHVLATSMSKDPAKRQSSALELASQLQRVQYELGLSVTGLEVASEEWAGAGAPVDFQNSQQRGPVRATVSYESKRPNRKRGTTTLPPQPEDDGIGQGGGGGLRLKTVVWLLLGTAVVVGGGVALAVILLRSGS